MQDRPQHAPDQSQLVGVEAPLVGAVQLDSDAVAYDQGISPSFDTRLGHSDAKQHRNATKHSNSIPGESSRCQSDSFRLLHGLMADGKLQRKFRSVVNLSRVFLAGKHQSVDASLTAALGGLLALSGSVLSYALARARSGKRVRNLKGTCSYSPAVGSTAHPTQSLRLHTHSIMYVH